MKFWLAVASIILSGFSAASITFGCCSGNTFKFNCVELPWKTYELHKLPGYLDKDEKEDAATTNPSYPNLPETDTTTSGLSSAASPSAPPKLHC